jgi:Caspase domain
MRIISVRWRLVMASAVGVCILASASLVGAQATRAEPRLALVIGNSAYRESPLRNPVNDVRAMAQRFRELGFTVIAHENATKRTMGGDPRVRAATCRGRRRRLLLCGPRPAGLPGPGRRRDRRRGQHPGAAVDVELLLEQMAEAKNRVNMVILDACRNNPFERFTFVK